MVLIRCLHHCRLVRSSCAKKCPSYSLNKFNCLVDVGLPSATSWSCYQIPGILNLVFRQNTQVLCCQDVFWCKCVVVSKLRLCTLQTLNGTVLRELWWCLKREELCLPSQTVWRSPSLPRAQCTDSECQLLLRMEKEEQKYLSLAPLPKPQEVTCCYCLISSEIRMITCLFLQRSLHILNWGFCKLAAVIFGRWGTLKVSNHN